MSVKTGNYLDEIRAAYSHINPMGLIVLGTYSFAGILKTEHRRRSCENLGWCTDIGDSVQCNCLAPMVFAQMLPGHGGLPDGQSLSDFRLLYLCHPACSLSNAR